MYSAWPFAGFVNIPFLFFSVLGAQAQNTFPDVGKVGIGTTDPQAALDISSGSIRIGDLVNSGYARVMIVNNDGSLDIAHEEEPVSFGPGVQVFIQSLADALGQDPKMLAVDPAGKLIPVSNVKIEAGDVIVQTGDIKVLEGSIYIQPLPNASEPVLLVVDAAGQLRPKVVDEPVSISNVHLSDVSLSIPESAVPAAGQAAVLVINEAGKIVPNPQDIPVKINSADLQNVKVTGDIYVPNMAQSAGEAAVLVVNEAGRIVPNPQDIPVKINSADLQNVKVTGDIILPSITVPADQAVALVVDETGRVVPGSNDVLTTIGNVRLTGDVIVEQGTIQVQPLPPDATESAMAVITRAGELKPKVLDEPVSINNVHLSDVTLTVPDVARSAGEQALLIVDQAGQIARGMPYEELLNKIPNPSPGTTEGFWDLNGNAGTSMSNKLGTLDAVDLRIVTAGVERMRVNKDYGIGVGFGSLAAPKALLDVSGTLKIADDEMVPATGMLRYTPAFGFEGYHVNEWRPLSNWRRTGNDLYYDLGNIGVGTAITEAQLHISALPAHTGFISATNHTAPYGYNMISRVNHDLTKAIVVENSTLGNQTNFLVYGNGNTFIKGNLGIGTDITGSFKLAVDGKIGAREIKVTLANPFPDYVFEKEYNLMSLTELEQFIKLNKHLPGIPSAKEVEKNEGIELGEMNAKLLEKVEELTLHLIELKKESEKLANRVNTLEKQNRR